MNWTKLNPWMQQSRHKNVIQRRIEGVFAGSVQRIFHHLHHARIIPGEDAAGNARRHRLLFYAPTPSPLWHPDLDASSQVAAEKAEQYSVAGTTVSDAARLRPPT